MMQLREYQRKAVRSVRSIWKRGVKSVCLVAPTGAGKTRLGEELIVGDGKVVWVAHRRELVLQAATRLRARFGVNSVGVVMPGEYRTPGARIQVGTVQTLLARGMPSADIVVLDEAHHYAAEEWRKLAEFYGSGKTLGLTATPERKDGEPLGDIFDELVVAAHYSELVRDGFLVQARVLQPPMDLKHDLAQDPIDAWAKHSEGSLTFLFAARVDIAYGFAKRFRDSGVLADTIEAETPKRERDEIFAKFRGGNIRVLCSVYALTEGVDVPEARTAILARAFGHVGSYLQAVGRVLRPSYGKDDAIVIDLTGATLRHGMPTDDRGYSLNGRAISGGTGGGGGGNGGDEFIQRVRGLELRAAGDSPRKMVQEVKLQSVDDKERRAEYERLLKLARQHRMRDGFAAVKYREKFGEEPRREWA